ncbi:MAG: hypothetical protein LBQ60_07490 [Bacteroidales bacterium]|jgi:hypothetical protein|nr:hypothetical protein [Bacteroidales bacterium]
MIDIVRVMIFVCFSQPVFAYSKNLEKTSVADTVKQYLEEVQIINGQVRDRVAIDGTFKWHPEEIHIMCLNMKIKFKLPYEKDQSGVANLLFQSKKSGEIHLLDTIRNNKRYYTWLSGKYDAILLYNNGKYIKKDNVIFEKNTSTEVDLCKNNVQPSDSTSLKWLTLRTFNAAIEDRVIRKNYTTVSEKKIRGYIFHDITGGPVWAWITAMGTDGIKKESIATNTNDGYFEFDVGDDIKQPLNIFGIGCINQEINIAVNSGLIYVSEEYPEPVNPTSGPLRKVQ